ESCGSLNDLKTAKTQTWDGSAWQDTGTSYHRYYTSSLLKYVVNPASYARLVAASYDPLTAADSVIAPYADHYFEYDASRRCTKDVVDGGALSHQFAYSQSTHTNGYNRWKTKTVETNPDGTQHIVYSNYAGQPMLVVLKSGTSQWCEFYKYGSDGQ